MEDLRRRFGNLVAAHRRRLGFTQDELAGKAAISVDMVSRIETGSTGASFKTISTLAGVFQVDPAELFTDRIPQGALDRQKLSGITARLSMLNDDDLDWVSHVLAAVLKHR